MGVDTVDFVKEIKFRYRVCQCEIGIEKGAYGSDVFPIAVEFVSVNLESGFYRVGKDFLAEILIVLFVQEVVQSFSVEDIHSHVCEEQPFLYWFVPQLEEPRAYLERIDDFRIVRFFDEAFDVSMIINVHYPELGDIFS
ncbi:hypothetical protein BMS3Bbin04_00706 [bacterium BMS3Bbin04]|nr:hypothetical protein BMS3Bbin04_00706 [bacterium BMS3Bbin04]